MRTLGAGGMAIVVDSPARENEGDLLICAEHADAESIAFMARHGRGLICAALALERLDELCVPPQPRRGVDPRGTAFHVGVDRAARRAHGITAPERAATIRALADPTTGPDEFDHPGHVFPLAARPGGVRERPGHTEAGVELARLAGCRPAAAICEVMAPDGTMLRLPGLLQLAAAHGLPVLAINDLVAHLGGGGAAAAGGRRVHAQPSRRLGRRGSIRSRPTAAADMPCVYDHMAHGPG